MARRALLVLIVGAHQCRGLRLIYPRSPQRLSKVSTWPAARSIGRSALVEEATPPAPADSQSQLGRQVAGALTLGVLDEATRVALRGSGVPHSLVCGIALFCALLFAREAGSKAHDSVLAPGCAVALKWMPAFFVPALVSLPLATPVVTSGKEAARTMAVLLVGLWVSLTSTALAASQFARTAPSFPAQSASSQKASGQSALVPLTASFCLCAALAPFYPNIAATIFFGLGTLVAYAASLRVTGPLGAFAARQRWATPIAKAAHPVAVCAALVTAFVRLIGSASPALDPILATALYSATGGAALQRLLGPCVVALACGVYSRRTQVIAARRPLLAGLTAGVVSGLGVTAVLARLFRLPDSAKLALLPRCITSPLAIAFCDALHLGVDPSASIAIVVATGVLGAAFGPSLLRSFDPISRGLAMGAAAHGVGTAQLAQEPDAQAFASIAMSLVGALSVFVAAFPPSRSCLLWLAGVSLPP